MEVEGTRELIEETVTFPTDSETVIDQVGDVEIRAPTGDTTSIAEILADLEGDSYESVDAVYAAIKGNLDDAFIGRKYYDDRGGARNVQHDPRENESL